MIILSLNLPLFSLFYLINKVANGNPKGFYRESSSILAEIPRKRVSHPGEKTFRVWGCVKTSGIVLQDVAAARLSILDEMAKDWVW